MAFDPIIWAKIKALQADVANIINNTGGKDYKPGNGITISDDNEISVNKELLDTITALQATITTLTPSGSEKTPEDVLTDALTDAITAKAAAEEAKILAENTAVWDTF